MPRGCWVQYAAGLKPPEDLTHPGPEDPRPATTAPLGEGAEAMRPHDYKSSLCTGLSVLCSDARRPLHRPVRRPAWLASWARSHPCLSHVRNSSLRGRQARLVQPSMVPVQLPARAHLRAAGAGSSGWAPAGLGRLGRSAWLLQTSGGEPEVEHLCPVNTNENEERREDGQRCVARVCDALGSPATGDNADVAGGA